MGKRRAEGLVMVGLVACAGVGRQWITRSGWRSPVAGRGPRFSLYAAFTLHGVGHPARCGSPCTAWVTLHGVGKPDGHRGVDVMPLVWVLERTP